jgi:hypothetical protein
MVAERSGRKGSTLGFFQDTEFPAGSINPSGVLVPWQTTRMIAKLANKAVKT